MTMEAAARDAADSGNELHELPDESIGDWSEQEDDDEDGKR